ncbi:MAG: PaaI family thioesterase [Actinomycetia bacterium]|nr:PaaI family thioesterase [Actinomycetes bacterium]MCP3909995.1 PaaI family thioesterase [Actinomycetes bacterium]MCP4084829.1 PaaI family thioesterase [Actinomycetes bacterium]
MQFPPAAEGVTTVSVEAFANESWPDGPLCRCLEISGRHTVVSRGIDANQLRPGGFISGPTQFGLADMALWFACFGAIGFEAMAMTSEMSIRFLRPATGSTGFARAVLDSVGGRTIVGSVTVWTDDRDRPTAVAQGSYARPRQLPRQNLGS